MKFEKLKPGMVLYDRHSERMGNTMLRAIGEWEVRVESVDVANRTAMCSWNGNRPSFYTERRLAKLSDWSMYDEGVVVVRGMLDRVVSVKRGKRRTPIPEPTKEPSTDTKEKP